MEFIITELKNCDLMEISGRVDSYTSPQIKEALGAIMAEGRCKIILDLKSVTYLSSSGMLTFINALKQCQLSEQGKIILAQVPPRILTSLELAGFNQLFDIYDDAAMAVKGFEVDP